MTIPIAVIGGYLGSGKTTLINRALSAGRPEDLADLAVLVNDFGSVNIDEALIRERSPDGRIIGLAGGCVCCAVQDDLGGALETVKPLGVGHVVIEASGVASPAKVASVGRDWPGYTDRGSMVLVDGDALPRLLEDKFVGRLVRRQIEEAGTLVGRGNVAAVERPVMHADDATVVTLLLDRERPLCSNPPSALPDPHVTGFSTLTLRQIETVPKDGLRSWLESLPEWVGRLKGFVVTDAGTVVVQIAGGRAEIAPGQQEQGRLVVIAPTAAMDEPQLLTLATPFWEKDDD